MRKELVFKIHPEKKDNMQQVKTTEAVTHDILKELLLKTNLIIRLLRLST